jgi:LacI family transcriptional regulator
MIGLMVPTFDEFHGAMLEHLARSVRRTGRALLTYCHGADPRIMEEALDFFAAQRIDALIMTGDGGMYDRVDELVEQGTPVIFYNNDLRGLAADRVFVENRKASYRAVTHLLDLGHECIGILCGNLDDSSGRERFEGYEQALAERQIAPKPSYVVDGGWTMRGGFDATKRLMTLPNPPTAIFASSYPMALGALGWLKDNGKKVPDDLSLVSFDDVPLFRLHEAGITSIAQPVEEIADAIADVLVARLTETEHRATRTITLDCDIILRGSTRRI